jgi:Chaperone of endosialidase
MADTKISGVAELDAVPAVGDWIPFVDVSDTTMSMSGTTKRLNADRFIYTNGTANTLAANLDVNSKNLTTVGTIAIGTATGARPLHVHAVSGDSYLRVSNNTFASGADIGCDATNFYYWVYGSVDLRFATNNLTRFTVSKNGNIGFGTTTPATHLHVHDTGSNYVRITNDTFTTGMDMGCDAVSFYLWNYSNSPLQFATNNAERVRITAAGDVGIGISSPGYKLDVNGAAHASSFPTSSDRRLKENLRPVGNVLGKLAQLTAYTFTWKNEYRADDQYYEDDVDIPDSEFETDPTSTPPVKPTEPVTKRKQRQLGFVAQEVRKVFPELVTVWNHEYADDRYIRALAVDYGRMVPIVVEAIKELVQRGQVLQTRVNQLEAKVAALEAA